MSNKKSLFDRVLIYDTEVTVYKHLTEAARENISPKKDMIGSAFCLPQQLVMSGFKWLDASPVCMPTDEGITAHTQGAFDYATLIVGCNITFDLHWARRIGVDISKVVVWELQIAEFLFSSQHQKYPSLNWMCSKYNLEQKLDVVKEEYWNKGLDTDEVPVEILREYLEQDLLLTEQVFKEQLFQFKGIRL